MKYLRILAVLLVCALMFSGCKGKKNDENTVVPTPAQSSESLIDTDYEEDKKEGSETKKEEENKEIETDADMFGDEEMNDGGTTEKTDTGTDTGKDTGDSGKTDEKTEETAEPTADTGDKELPWGDEKIELPIQLF